VVVEVVNVGELDTAMVALVVPDTEMSFPAVSRAVMFWKVGVEDP
jgi:hypothetical protein